MATFHFDLVSPEKLLFSGEVDQVDVPGSEGDFGVLAGHAPLVATLRPGILVIYRDGGSQGGRGQRRLRRGRLRRPDRARRHGGAVEEFDRDVLAGVIKDTEEDVADTADDARQARPQARSAQGAAGALGPA